MGLCKRERGVSETYEKALVFTELCTKNDNAHLSGMSHVSRENFSSARYGEKNLGVDRKYSVSKEEK